MDHQTPKPHLNRGRTGCIDRSYPELIVRSRHQARQIRGSSIHGPIVIPDKNVAKLSVDTSSAYVVIPDILPQEAMKEVPVNLTHEVAAGRECEHRGWSWNFRKHLYDSPHCY